MLERDSGFGLYSILDTLTATKSITTSNALVYFLEGGSCVGCLFLFFCFVLRDYKWGFYLGVGMYVAVPL